MSIEISNVSKTFSTLGKRHTVYKNFNLTIERGVNWGMIGPNGSGKTTLLRLLAGALQPDTGFIRRNMSVSWPLGYSGGLVDQHDRRARTAASSPGSTARTPPR